MIDLAIYAGRWVALKDKQVAGVGHFAEEALRQARRNRPRDRFTVRFVETEDGERLPLPALLDQLQPFWQTLEQPVYLVGGVVRDALLGNTNADLDFVTNQGGVRLAFAAGDWLGAPAYPLDKSRDTGRVVLTEERLYLDFSVYRGSSLLEDLRRRDFTINAMALPASARRASSLVDPLGGAEDLRAKIIRLASENAISDDPIRALRGARLAIQLGFDLAPETIASMRKDGEGLRHVSGERIRDEALKLFQMAQPAQALGLLAKLDLLAIALPEIAALADVAQSPPHHEPVLAHTMRTLRWLSWLENLLFGRNIRSEMPAFAAGLEAQVRETFDPYLPALRRHFQREIVGGLTGWHLLRWGALWHDAGKAATQTTEDGKIRFLGHDHAGAQLAKKRLKALKFSREGRDLIAGMANGHMRPLLLANEKSVSRRAIYRFYRACGEAGLDICLLALADHLATYDRDSDSAYFEANRATWEKLLAVVDRLIDRYVNQYKQVVKPPPLLTGNELMAALGLQPGPEVGRLLRLIEEGQAAGEINSQEEAVAFARQAHG